MFNVVNIRHFALLFADIGHQYYIIESLMRHWSKALPGKVLKVHYEALVNNFEHEARRIVTYCGLDWEDNILSFHETERPIMTASMAQVCDFWASWIVQNGHNYLKCV